MPAAKRSSSSTAKSSSAKSSSAKSSSARRSSKSAGKPASKSGSGAASKRRTAARSAAPQAKGTGTTAARPAAAQAKATGTTARKPASRGKATSPSGGGAATRARTTARGREQITLTRARVQEVLNDAASRGRITRKDANELVAEIMRRGHHTGDEVAELVSKGRAQLESATRKVRKAEPVDRLVRGADRARRAAGVGPSFPITGYDELNVTQVQARIKELTRPEQRKVLNYERKHANRRSVVGALEKTLS